jgi:hypothetical protein
MRVRTGLLPALLVGTAMVAGCTSPGAPIRPSGVARDFTTSWVPIPDNPDIGLYAEVGTVELKIRDFYPRKLVRDVSIQPRGGPKVSQPKQNFGNGKTLWDIDGQALCTGTARQKVRVNIVIDTDKNVFFQSVEIGGRPSAAIGAADAASAQAFSSATLPAPVPGTPDTWVSSFWLLCEATPAARLSKFNLALDVRDSNEVGYGLPLIVDPVIRNRG